jgi:hypothetical protein
VSGLSAPTGSVKGWAVRWLGVSLPVTFTATALPQAPASALEAVAHAGFGDEVPGPGGFGFELAAQLGKVNPQVVGFTVVGGSPDFGEQSTLGDEDAAVPVSLGPHPSCGALVPRLGAVAHELFKHPGCFKGVFVLQDPDGEPACRSELSIGVAVATGDAAELQTPPAGVGLLPFVRPAR